ncbi:MAG: response regulator [Caulobacter sp.]|nr:response regulator [Caulobacter sp.]
MQKFARRRVLIVDDNAHARTFLGQILDAVNVVVLQAESGPQALKMLGTAHVDVVFVDMFMTPMDGIALTREIRASDKASVAGLPVVMASAQANRDVVQGAMAAGVSGFIAKPFSPALVLKQLAIALARRQPVRPSPVQTAFTDEPDGGQAMAYL